MATQIWPIGTEFKTRGKHPRKAVVVDIYRTYNNAGELVQVRHVAEHDFCGQTVTDYDVPCATIARGLME